MDELEQRNDSEARSTLRLVKQLRGAVWRLCISARHTIKCYMPVGELWAYANHLKPPLLLTNPNKKIPVYHSALAAASAQKYRTWELVNGLGFYEEGAPGGGGGWGWWLEWWRAGEGWGVGDAQWAILDANIKGPKITASIFGAGLSCWELSAGYPSQRPRMLQLLEFSHLGR